MNCPKCGLLIGHGTMGTVTPLCQCAWNQKVLVGSTSKGREVAELLQQLAEYKQRAEAAEAKLRESEMQEPVQLEVSICGIKWPFKCDHPLYAKPFPAPKQEEK